VSDPVASSVIREMIRADLELAWDHLENDLLDLAEHELRNALEKVTQLKEVTAQPSHGPCGTHQPLLTITLDDHQNTGTGTDPQINR
jgi:hypothetical protein